MDQSKDSTALYPVFLKRKNSDLIPNDQVNTSCRIKGTSKKPEMKQGAYYRPYSIKIDPKVICN